MDPDVTTLERAFALAASGRFHKVSDIRLQLHREGYNHGIVQGPALSRQLGEVMHQAAERTNFSQTKMATNKPTGDNARKGAVRKRSQLTTKIEGEDTWTKRSKKSGQFIDQKKAPAKKPFKGVRTEKAKR